MIHFKIFENINKDVMENLNNIRKNTLNSVFQLPDWIDIVAKNLNHFDKLKIVFVYNNNDTILVAPFRIRNIFGCKELCWLSSDIIDYNNIIISNSFNFKDVSFKQVWKKIIYDLSDKCDLIFFNKNPEFIGSVQNPIINSKYKYYQKSYQLNLDSFDYDYFYKTKNNNKSKQTDRRKEKKLNHGDDLICSYENINSQNFQLIEKLISEKIFSYKSKKEKTFDYKNVVNQYKELVCSNSLDYKFNLSILKKNNIKISSILGVIYNGIYYYLIPVTHNSKFKQLSPGRFHIINLIRWSIKNNIKTIDFTAGDEPYKLNWSNNNFKMLYYIEPLTLKGNIRFVFLKLYYKLRERFFFKRIRQHLI